MKFLAGMTLLFFALFIAYLFLPSAGLGYFNGLPLAEGHEIIALVIGLLWLSFGAKQARQLKLLTLLVAGAVLFKAPLFFSETRGICFRSFAQHKGEIKWEESYEGSHNAGCYVRSQGFDDTGKFPFEFINNYMEADRKENFNPGVAFSTAYLVPEAAERIVVTAKGQVAIELQINGQIVDTSAGADGYLYSIPVTPGSRGTLSGKALYRPDHSERRQLIFHFSGPSGEIKQSRYDSHFFAQQPGASNGLLTFSLRISELLVLGVLMLQGVLILLELKAWSLSFLVVFVPNILLYLYFTRTGGIHHLNYFLALVMLTVLLIKRVAELKPKQLSFLILGVVFGAYGMDFPHMIEGYSVMSEGDDWWTQQKYARIAWFGGGLNQFCPPSFNYTFCYFVGILHTIFGQALIAQQAFEVLALGLMAIAVALLSEHWGAKKTISRLGACLFLLVHCFSQVGYIKRGITEHPSAGLILASYLTLSTIKGLNGWKNLWLLAASVFMLFVAVSWRPNFAICAVFAIFALVDKNSINSLRESIRVLWQKRYFAIPVAIIPALTILLLSMRNYVLCGAFVTISKGVQNIYKFGLNPDDPWEISRRLNSIVAMGTMHPEPLAPGLALQERVFSLIVASGFVAAFAAGVMLLRPQLRTFLPCVLGLIALATTGFHFFLYDIAAGYGVRWGIPLLVFWIISLVFVFQILSARIWQVMKRRT